jgi:hypothetical protein
LGLEEFWTVLQELARGEATRLSSAIGQVVHLYAPKNPTVWSNPNTYQWTERTHLYISRSGNTPFYEIFGYQLFDRLGPRLRGLERPYGSLREIADGMVFFGGCGSDNNNANALSEVSAEFPIQMADCFYNPAHGGIEIQVRVGVVVPLDRLSATLTPDPRVRLTGDTFRSETTGDIRKLTALVPCDEPQAEVAVSVQFDDVHIASSRISRQTPSSVTWDVAATDRSQDWEATLNREFHWTSRVLRRRLRAVLPGRVADVAEWRIRESILLREEHPFYAVASAASVAEVLLKERLAKVSRKVRAASWERLRSENPHLPRRLPDDEYLKFEHAIRFAQELGLVSGIETNSIDLLRAARNQIHIDKKSRPPVEDFSPVRAAQAILATLDLCKLLGTVSRARPRKRQPPCGST